MDFLVGYSGFVGSNLAAQHRFDGLFRSGNIAEAYGKKPDLLSIPASGRKCFWQIRTLLLI